MLDCFVPAEGKSIGSRKPTVYKEKYIMVTLITKALFIPIIQNSRLTCLGMQYTVADPDFYHIVTANDKNIICSCSEHACPHIQMVQVCRAQYAASDAYRDAYAALFDLSYGD